MPAPSNEPEQRARLADRLVGAVRARSADAPALTAAWVAHRAVRAAPRAAARDLLRAWRRGNAQEGHPTAFQEAHAAWTALHAVLTAWWTAFPDGGPGDGNEDDSTHMMLMHAALERDDPAGAVALMGGAALPPVVAAERYGRWLERAVEMNRPLVLLRLLDACTGSGMDHPTMGDGEILHAIEAAFRRVDRRAFWAPLLDRLAPDGALWGARPRPARVAARRLLALEGWDHLHRWGGADAAADEPVAWLGAQAAARLMPLTRPGGPLDTVLQRKGLAAGWLHALMRVNPTACRGAAVSGEPRVLARAGAQGPGRTEALVWRLWEVLWHHPDWRAHQADAYRHMAELEPERPGTDNGAYHATWAHVMARVGAALDPEGADAVLTAQGDVPAWCQRLGPPATVVAAQLRRGTGMTPSTARATGRRRTL